MNKMDEIVIDINKDKTKLQEKKPKQINKKTSIYKYDLHNWLLLLREKMSKRGYKKAIKDIISAGLIDQFKSSDLGYKITVIYIQAKLKIIEKKIFKYHIIQNDKLRHHINRCFYYARSLPYELNTLLERMPKHLITNPQSYYDDIKKRGLAIEYVDDVIRCYFDYIYIMALFHSKLNNCMECVAYLDLGYQLFKITKYFILSPHTLYKAQKCCILLSKIYIINEDYENALIILNDGIKICFKQILFQVHDIYMGFFIGEKKDIKVREKSDLDKLKDARMKKVILNIVIIFLYIGICHENMSNIKKATAFYKQCEWFTRIFLLKDNNIIYKLLLRLKKKSIEVCNIIDFLQERIVEIDKKLKKKMEEALKEELKKKHRKDNLFYDIKFKKLVDKLDKLKIKEIDTVNSLEKKEMLKNLSSTNKKTRDKYLFMSNIRLLEAYLTKDFRSIVSNMKKITIFDLDSVSRGKIQKAMDNLNKENEKEFMKNEGLNLIHDDKRKNIGIKRLSYKENKDENSKSSKVVNKRYSQFILERNNNKKKLTLNLSVNKFLQNQFKIQFSKNEKKSSKSLLLIRKDSAIKTARERKSISSTNLLNSPISDKQSNVFSFNTPSNKTFIERIKSSPPKTVLKKKVKFNLFNSETPTPKGHYFLNFRYLKKRNYIKKLCDREINFQKCLIRTKKAPMPNIKYYSKGLSQIEADNSFGKIKSLVSNVMINSDWKDNMSEIEYKEYLLKTKLENTFLSSLNNNALEKYMTLTNKKEKEVLETSKYEKSLREIDKNNESTLDELTLKLNAIYENEQKRKRETIIKNMQINNQIIKRLYRNKSSFGRNEERNEVDNKHLKFSTSVKNMSDLSMK